MTTTIDRTAYNALVDDDGTGGVGTVYQKSNVKDILDAIDAVLAGNLTLGAFLSIPNQPSARVYNSATQTLTTGVVTTLTFDTEDWDVGNLHSTSVNTSRLTCPTGGAGKYRVVATVDFASNSTGARQLRLLKTGSAEGTFINVAPLTSGDNTIAQLVREVQLADGDYVEIQAFQSSGGNLATGSSTRTLANEFSMSKIL